MCRLTLLVVLVGALGAVSAYPTDEGYRVKRGEHDGYHSPSDHCEDDHQHGHHPHGAHGHDSSNWDDSDENEDRDIKQQSEEIDVSQVEQSEVDFGQGFEPTPFKSITEDAKLLFSDKSRSVPVDTQNATPQVALDQTSQSEVSVAREAEFAASQREGAEFSNVQPQAAPVAFDQTGQSSVNVGQNAQSELILRQTVNSESTNSQTSKLQIAFNENEQSGVNIGIKVPAELAEDQTGNADSTSNNKKIVQFADDQPGQSQVRISEFINSQNERKPTTVHDVSHNPFHVDQAYDYNNNHGNDHHHHHHDHGKENEEYEHSHKEYFHAHAKQTESPCTEKELPPITEKINNLHENVKHDDVVVPKVEVVQPIPADIVREQETPVPAIPQEKNTGFETSQMKKQEHDIHEYPFHINKGSDYYNQHDHVKEKDTTEIPPIADKTNNQFETVKGDNMVVSKVDDVQPIPTDTVGEEEVPVPAIPQDKKKGSDTSQKKEDDIYQKPSHTDEDIDYHDYHEHHEHHEHPGHHKHHGHHDGPSVEYHL